MRLLLVCVCVRALAPPGRPLTRRDAADLVGGTWAGWQREFDVEGGAAPLGYELTSSERLDGDVLERSFVTPVERSTSVVDAGRLVAVEVSKNKNPRNTGKLFASLGPNVTRLLRLVTEPTEYLLEAMRRRKPVP